jgi:hypothetical protein
MSLVRVVRTAYFVTGDDGDTFHEKCGVPGVHPGFFLGGRGLWGYPDAIHNLCLILKIML